MQHQIFIDNMYKVLETIFILIFCLHALVCCFIAIGHIATTDDTNDSWVIVHNLLEEEQLYGYNSPNNGKNFALYWTAWYFVTTSITTVGYGEISGFTAPEKLFIIFLLFTGILIFTII